MYQSNTYLSAVGSGILYLQTNEGDTTKVSIPNSGYVDFTTSGGSAGSKSGRPYWGYSGTSIFTSSYNFPTSIRANQSILTMTYFITNSDARIKKDIQDLGLR